MKDQRIVSGNLRYELVMQGDGNAVIYETTTGRAIWASNSEQPAPPEPPIPPVPPPPEGQIHIVNGQIHDARGPFNPFGFTFFWAPWGYKLDRERMLDNARFMARSGAFDYARIFAQVDWTNRPIDPTWPDYDEVLRGTVDELYNLGLRTQVTILAGAGGPGVATPEERATFVGRVAGLLDGRADKLFGYEIANEAVGLPGAEGIAEMRDLARRLKAATRVPVAITSADHSSGVYVNSRDFADYATIHYDRDISKADGYDRPTRQPWGWPGEYVGDGLPEQAVDNEGIGPYASVAEDRDPLRNVTRRAVALISGNLASLYHCGPGIYGDADMTSSGPANLWEAEGIEPTLKGFAVLKRLLPPGISGWNRSNHHWTSYPFNMVTPVGDEAIASGIGCVRAYATDNGQTIVCLPFGIRGHVEMIPRFGMAWTVYNPLTGEVLDAGDSERIVLTEAPTAQLILAQRR